MRPRVRLAAFFLPLLLQAAFLLAALPYPLLTYNWLAGGVDQAYQTLPVGWGEEASAAARRLAAVTDGGRPPALFSSTTVSTAPFYEGEIYRNSPAYLTLLQKEDYLLLTGGRQQRPQPGGRASHQAGRDPAQIISINGREQAWLYSGLQASDLGLPALRITPRAYRFAHGPQITAGGAAFLPWPEETLIAIAWQGPAGAAPGSYRLQLQMVDEAVDVRASQEQPLLNRNDQLPWAWPAGTPQTVYYTQPIPPELPPGAYQVVAHLYDEQGARLGVFEGERFAGTAAPVAEVMVTPPAAQPPLPIPRRPAAELELVGVGPIPERIGNGAPTAGELQVNVLWQAQAAAEIAYTAFIHLLDEAGNVVAQVDSPLSPPSTSWVPEQVIAGQYTLPLPAAPAGAYRIALGLYDADSGRRFPLYQEGERLAGDRYLLDVPVP